MVRNFILASASPRRAELLKKLVPDFEVCPAKIAEVLNLKQSAVENAERLATEKARAVFRSGSVTLGVDTLGELAGEIFGKPTDLAAAREMLHQLSGQTHRVVSGYCLKSDERELAGHAVAQVAFRLLPFHEIAEYIGSHPVTDYAGGYAIQGMAGKFVEKLEGEIETVIGLPMKEIDISLREFGLKNSKL